VSAEDIESMREALAALGHVPPLLVGFGVERLTMSDDFWSERLMIRGTGKAVLTTLRSFGDASGEAIGRFETKLSDKSVADLIRAVDATLEGGPTPRLSLGDVRTLVSIVACGSRLDHVVGGGPLDLEPYTPLLLALDKAAFETRAIPKSTLELHLEVPTTLTPGPQTLPVVLSFQNRGDEGTWIRSPASGLEDEPTEHVRLWYAEMTVEQPGVTPLPLEPLCTALDPVVRVQRPLLWIGGGEIESRPFSASVDLTPGSYLVRASFASYGGDETVAGQNLLRGCVFSAETVVEVRK
jgi:hypothetical protein